MLKITPDELVLEPPFKEVKRTMFCLTNDLAKNQVYKIKSTAPERISVSPNSGFIRAYDRVEVSVKISERSFQLFLCAATATGIG